MNTFTAMYKAYRDVNSLTEEEMVYVKDKIIADEKLYYTDRSGYWMPFELREKRSTIYSKIAIKLRRKDGTS